MSILWQRWQAGRPDTLLRSVQVLRAEVRRPPILTARGLERGPAAGKILGRSVHLRHVDCGSCNAPDWELTNLLGPWYDVQQAGFDFVASPRHADVLLVTGGVAANLEKALRETYAATPEPRLVVALAAEPGVGSCCHGAAYARRLIEDVVPVDAYVLGCPPRPAEVVYGLMVLLGWVPADAP